MPARAATRTPGQYDPRPEAVRAVIRRCGIREPIRVSLLSWAAGVHANQKRPPTPRERAVFFRSLGMNITEAYTEELRARVHQGGARVLTVTAARARIAAALRR